MQLEHLYLFPTDAVLNAHRRKLIEAQILETAQRYEREIELKWLQRKAEKFLRILVSPVTIEIVFHDDRIDVFGAAPAWAWILFTGARKAELRQRILEVLLLAGFMK